MDEFLTSDLTTIFLDLNMYLKFEGRTRSTIAHEIGHLFLHKEVFQKLNINSVEKLNYDLPDIFQVSAVASEKLIANSEELWNDFNFWPFLGAGLVRTVNSPYNTYRIKALPPGPICSPSIDSIRAVAYPAETDALYYLHSPDKQIHTAKTFKEHQENIVKYLQ